MAWPTRTDNAMCRWRHLIPLLPKSAPLFVPDMPGYGATLPIEKMDKLSVGNALLKALKTQVKRSVLDAEKVKEIPGPYTSQRNSTHFSARTVTRA